ncbi:hypothetical protein [Streptomyces sp. NPDC057909]|uniref:hypothetical protein n=1 Tax=Streptomyces sp. NPDC057909 TaxID=3346277 RepID=UPI0036DFD0AE
MSGLARWSAARTIHRALGLLYVARTTALLSSDGTTHPPTSATVTPTTPGSTGSVRGPLGLPVAVWITIVPAALVTVLLR